ncbi:DNA gyrase subunit A [Caminibacter pacificus]|jgi:DNA gyrase subunit A|uniref:DNA gyrase subunit A n=1 Tax=Caminibacter pacificus TaxID=1424653 RepID=A0AAJ4REF1_9BACT|nr:DNA gyrase subunit A [Caminibacter pacificus]NPA87149.1 DNA gyrase subunit A [Campylobacterota bacterium]QCI28070.1 DNA gyrase subunit A [Caminibacter pacificus]ROR41222.1 DNA gyrase subunit A [Caminibacter pacificus]
MQVIPVKIEETLAKSYLEYSMSVIVGRALPDVRDGLKPVHRRILYAMYKMGITSSSAYKKSARIVGDVIGKYHPHGDSAVYEALVRMAQDFSMRMPLIDGQGNFGSIDGDNAAAMRYTEARLTKIAEELLKDIDKDTVDFVPNYDGTEKEPVVLPARFPNLLVNGSSGIAVGMATNIPPHNLTELLDALIYMIDNKEATLDDILQFVKGPDFPTGGIIFGRSGIIEAYKTGRGSIKIRAKHHIEHRGNREIIVIDELPYQVNKAKLIEKISDLVKDKIVEGISEIRDESDREGIRVVIELKKDAMSEIVLNNLYKHTQMQVSFGINMLAIIDKEPKLFNLMEILNTFIKFRKTVVIRRTIYELEEAKRRAHILEGLLIALANIDEVVEIIKKSADAKEAKAKLMDRFSLSEVQAQAILDMKLSRLTSLETEKLQKEYDELMEKIAYLTSILKEESVLNGVIKEEFIEIKNKYHSDRLTEIEDDYDAIDIEDLIPNEDMVVTITHRGYVKRVPLKTYERQNRGGKGKKALTTYEDDFIEDFYIAKAHDTLMIITDKGQLHWLKVYKIPEGSRTSKGKAIVNLINLDKDEKIQTIIKTSDFDENKSLAFFTKNGVVKRTNLSEFKNIRSTGVRAITIDENDELVTAKIVKPEDKELFIVTKKGMAIRFPVDTVREMGRSARGVRGITFKIEGDEVVGALSLRDENQEILTVSEKGFGKRTEANAYRLTNRGGKGVIAMKLTNKTGDLVGVVATEKDHDLMLLTSKGKMIRTAIESISKTGKNTQGVRIVKLDSDDKVVSVAKTPSEKSLEESELPLEND